MNSGFIIACKSDPGNKIWNIRGQRNDPCSFKTPATETDTKPTRAVKNRHKTPTASYSKEQQVNPKSHWYTRVLYNNLRQATQGKTASKIVGKDEVASSNLASSSKKRASRKTCSFFVFVSARAQHHLTVCGQHHFVRSTNIIVPLGTQNGVTPCGVNDVAFGKRCGLSPNDVALRANVLSDLQKSAIFQLLLHSQDGYGIIHLRHNFIGIPGMVYCFFIPLWGDGKLCVTAIGAMRFPVRSFGYALFILQKEGTHYGTLGCYFMHCCYYCMHYDSPIHSQLFL